MTLSRYTTRFEPEVPLEAIRPHPRNPNHSDVGRLGGYMDEVGGFYGAVLVQESSGYILAGEHRWKALKAKGELFVPVLYQGVDDSTALRILALDNRSAELGVRDEAELVALLELLRNETGSVEGTGYDAGFLDAELERLAGEYDRHEEEEERSSTTNTAGAGFNVDAVSSNEWYTPEQLLDAAREVHGDFDLDPASCEEANEAVRADEYYTKEDDGLAQTWAGVVWLNPPYGLDEDNVSNQAQWSDKLRREFLEGDVEAGFLLVTFVPDRSWFEPLWAFPMCVPRGRIKYRRPGGEEGSQPIGSSVVIYFGENYDAFREAFEPIGRIFTPEGVNVTRVSQ